MLAVAFSPDGKQIGVSTGNADLTFWNAETLDQMAAIDCRLNIFNINDISTLDLSKNFNN